MATWATSWGQLAQGEAAYVLDQLYAGRIDGADYRPSYGARRGCGCLFGAVAEKRGRTLPVTLSPAIAMHQLLEIRPSSLCDTIGPDSPLRPAEGLFRYIYPGNTPEMEQNAAAAAAIDPPLQPRLPLMEVLAGPWDWLYVGFSEKTCDECFHPLKEWANEGGRYWRCSRCDEVRGKLQSNARRSSAETFGAEFVINTVNSSGKEPPKLPDSICRKHEFCRALGAKIVPG